MRFGKVSEKILKRELEKPRVTNQYRKRWKEKIDGYL